MPSSLRTRRSVQPANSAATQQWASSPFRDFLLGDRLGARRWNLHFHAALLELFPPCLFGAGGMRLIPRNGPGQHRVVNQATDGWRRIMTDYRDPDFRNPNDPLRRDTRYDSDARTTNAAWGWIAGAVLVVVVLAVAVGLGHTPRPNTNTAANETAPPAVNQMAPPAAKPVAPPSAGPMAPPANSPASPAYTLGPKSTTQP